MKKRRDWFFLSLTLTLRVGTAVVAPTVASGTPFDTQQFAWLPLFVTAAGRVSAPRNHECCLLPPLREAAAADGRGRRVTGRCWLRGPPVLVHRAFCRPRWHPYWGGPREPGHHAPCTSTVSLSLQLWCLAMDSVCSYVHWSGACSVIWTGVVLVMPSGQLWAVGRRKAGRLFLNDSGGSIRGGHAMDTVEELEEKRRTHWSP